MAEKDKVVTEEFELTDEALKAITTSAKDALLPEVKKMLEEQAETSTKTLTELIEDHLAKIDKTIKKNTKADDEEDESDPIVKGLKDGSINKDILEMTPAMRFFRQMKALADENRDELAKYNKVTLALQLSARKKLEKENPKLAMKAGYANEGTAADGSVLVPDAEFVTTVFDGLPNYGVAFSDADVRQTDRTAVRVISLSSGLTFYRTAEAGVKTSAKLAFSKNEVSLIKYAVIVPATDELSDDAAIDYWNLVTRELTRAYARTADEITFIDTTTGITNLSGVRTQTYGATLNWDDLLTAQGKTEDDLDESNNKWYMRKETWYSLVQTKGVTNDHYIGGSLNTATGWVANPNQPTTPWGTPVKYTRVLPTINSISANDGLAVYGDLRNYLLYNKRGMALKMLTEATIHDASNVETNLAEQDMSAMRAVIRLLGICPDGNRNKFVILGSGTVS
jgi:HK97 family phage major capsid protein